MNRFSAYKNVNFVSFKFAEFAFMLHWHFFPNKEFSDDFVRYRFCDFSLPIKGEKS